MSNTKNIDDFAKIDPAAAKRIKPVREDQRYIKATEEVQKYEAELSITKNQIENFSKITIQDQARQYINSGSEQKLKSKEELIHHRQVLEETIKMAREKVRQTEAEIIRQECEQIVDIATHYEDQTLKAFEAFVESLRLQRLLYSYMESKGFRQEYRPAHWRVTDAENQFLLGYVPFGPPDEYIKQRRQFWKINGD